MSTLSFISTPVILPKVPEEIVTEIIIVDIWESLKAIPNSEGVESKRGNTWERPIPYKAVQRYIANYLNPILARIIQVRPEISWTATRIFNFRLYFIFIQPKTNLKTVLRIQKIELSFAASSLVLIPFFTA